MNVVPERSRFQTLVEQGGFSAGSVIAVLSVQTQQKESTQDVNDRRVRVMFANQSFANSVNQVQDRKTKHASPDPRVKRMQRQAGIQFETPSAPSKDSFVSSRGHLLKLAFVWLRKGRKKKFRKWAVFWWHRFEIKEYYNLPAPVDGSVPNRACCTGSKDFIVYLTNQLCGESL
ncbi:hypothetical protein BC832DRAFT_569465 [Gaertneriomyces semiglobifer]|nr:hypothetical protein BC832DRAFT_569465 [Gaertneriomyces semiglobifer]